MSFYLKLLAVFVVVLATENWSQANPGVIPKQMTEYFPVGRTFNGVKIPSYNGDRLNSVLVADTVTRIDDVFLSLTNLIVKSYDATGTVVSTVSMDRARYSLLSQEFVSETPAKVVHERFVMTGDQLGYNTAKDVSTMKGNVRVVIPNAKNFTGNFGMDALKGN